MFGSLVWSKLLHVMLVYQCAGFWFLEVLPNIVKHVLTMFNWFGGLVFGIWFVSVWDHLVHVMLVCQLLVLISQGSFQTSSNMFSQCSTGLELSCFQVARNKVCLDRWFGTDGLYSAIGLVSQGLSKHRQTCLHNAQLV